MQGAKCTKKEHISSEREDSCWHFLPLEMVAIILFFATQPSSLHDAGLVHVQAFKRDSQHRHEGQEGIKDCNEKRDAVTWIICRFVCKQWHEILPSRPLYAKHYASEAARRGSLKLLTWGRENGCCWDVSTCKFAAEGGHLDVLKWLREKGCPWDHDTCTGAAAYGHLEVLQWARENESFWNKEAVCKASAWGGHLDMLKWAIENGCSWVNDCSYLAGKGGHLEVGKRR